MAVSSTTRKQQFTLNQVTDEFDFTFRALPDVPTDIKSQVTTNGTTYSLVYTTDYTVSVESDGNGGTLTLVNAAAVSKGTITVYRETTNTQTSDYDDYNQFPSDTLEEDLDIRTFVSQEAAEDVVRAFKLSVTQDTTLVDTTIPPPAGTKTFGWNSAGDAIINYDNPGVVSAIATAAATAASTSAVEASTSATTSASHATTASDFASVATSSATVATSEATTAASILEKVYPVGSVYTNAAVATNPATLLGLGTWVAIEGECVVGLVAGGEFDTLGTVSEGETTHTLSTAELASHSHKTDGDDGGSKHASRQGSDGPFDYSSGTASNEDMGYIDNSITGTAGSGTAHNNIQPSYVCYVWRRTA